jgi:hypothetical protein
MMMVLYQKLYETFIVSGCHNTYSPFPLSNAAFETVDTLSAVSEDGTMVNLDHEDCSISQH